jgi:hypothetical protein
MSAPAANAFSLPVSTMAPIAGSASKQRAASLISAISCEFSALSALGRFSVISATAPRASVSSVEYAAPEGGQRDKKALSA